MVAKPKKKKNEDDRSRVFFPFHLYLTFLLFLLTLFHSTLNVGVVLLHARNGMFSTLLFPLAQFSLPHLPLSLSLSLSLSPLSSHYPPQHAQHEHCVRIVLGHERNGMCATHTHTYIYIHTYTHVHNPLSHTPPLSSPPSPPLSSHSLPQHPPQHVRHERRVHACMRIGVISTLLFTHTYTHLTHTHTLSLSLSLPLSPLSLLSILPLLTLSYSISHSMLDVSYCVNVVLVHVHNGMWSVVVVCTHTYPSLMYISLSYTSHTLLTHTRTHTHTPFPLSHSPPQHA